MQQQTLVPSSNRKVFLTAAWEHLIMANYPVDDALLTPYLPAGVSLDYWQGQAYVSLVGFLFRHVRVLGMKIPYHVHFPEVNLRFYVKFKENNIWKRGVVFISEIVPKPAIVWVANSIFREHYRTMPMKSRLEKSASSMHVGYEWKCKGKWNSISVDADVPPIELQTGSEEEFITQHFFGYSVINKDRAAEYEVNHPRWNIHPVRSYNINCDFERCYGNRFSFLANQDPSSVFLAEGSPVEVYHKRFL